jgi:hypothetical protein
MSKPSFRFVRDHKCLEEQLRGLKGQRCNRCGCAESLNRHSILYGNDPADCAQQVVRGQRVWCSDRGQRGGCGKTFSIFLADILPRHTVSATLLWNLLGQWLTGASLKAAAESLRLPFALETLYQLVQRLRQRLDVLRPLLCQKRKPPASEDADPLGQTVRHLQSLFSSAACPLQEFQLLLARPLMG